MSAHFSDAQRDAGTRPFSPSSARNAEPILAVLREHFADRRRVLEIGSGTGQHAVHFAAALPHLCWQASDRAENLPGIEAWREHAGQPNTPPPLCFDVDGAWPSSRFDAVFSANTLHIMSMAQVETLFAKLPQVLEADAVLVIYGPFVYRDRPTAPSNRDFDASLRARDPRMGLRHAETVQALAAQAGLAPLADLDMPANNRILIWRTLR